MFGPDGARPGEGRGEVFALGLRNPYRFTLDGTRIWLGDVGEDRWEEINLVVPGGNYGWPVLEGPECFPGPDAECDADAFDAPIYAYPHEGGQAVIVGPRMGADVPALEGDLIFADFESQQVFALRSPEGTPEAVEIAREQTASFAQDHEGAIYTVGVFPFRVHRIVAGEADRPLPERLAETGCMDPSEPQRPGAGFVPYDVQAPLWSDAADKTRFVALPPEGAFEVGPSGDLALPEGSVTMKNFVRGGRLLETRLMMRRADGWSGATYRWNAEGAEATVVRGPTREAFAEGEWLYPAPYQCTTCHTDAAGGALGLDQRQQSEATQAMFVERGWLTATDTGDSLVDLDADASLDERARSYLHSNCSHCHRADHPSRAALDLRAEVPLAETGLCEAPRTGDLGLVGAQILAPGEPDRSVLLARVGTRGPDRMPPLATSVGHDEAVALLSEWVESLTVCD